MLNASFLLHFEMFRKLFEKKLIILLLLLKQKKDV